MHIMYVGVLEINPSETWVSAPGRNETFTCSSDEMFSNITWQANEYPINNPNAKEIFYNTGVTDVGVLRLRNISGISKNG